MKTNKIHCTQFCGMYYTKRLNPNDTQTKIIRTIASKLNEHSDNEKSLYEKLESKNVDIFFDGSRNPNEVKVIAGKKNSKWYNEDDSFVVGSFSRDNAETINDVYKKRYNENKGINTAFYMICGLILVLGGGNFLMNRYREANASINQNTNTTIIKDTVQKAVKDSIKFIR